MRLNGVPVDKTDSEPRFLGCWKHTPPWWFPENWMPRYTADVVFVVMRHPLTWVTSMNKTHYDVRCQSWTTAQHCTMGMGTFWAGVRHRPPCDTLTPPRGESFDYLEDLWVRYATGWKRRDVRMVRLEDFIVQTSVAWSCNALPARSHVDVPAKPSKTHGHSSDLAAAQRLLQSADMPRVPLADRICERTRAARAELSYRC